MASLNGNEVPIEAPEEKEEAQATPAVKTVVLRSSDGQEFEVDQSLAMGSGTIRNLMEDGCLTGVMLPLPNITGSILAKVLEYWTAQSKPHRFADIGRDEMFELIMAVKYLSIQPLGDLLCQAVVDTIKNMSVEEMREYFNITNDYTPEEEEMRKERDWAIKWGRLGGY